MAASNVARVRLRSGAEATQRIEAGIAESVRWHASHPEQIDRRLHELEDEWGVERLLQAHTSALAFIGVALGAVVHRRWLAVPALATIFLFQHALQGWCPPMPVLRSLGFRTIREIDTERYALKALRGDFGPIGPGPHNRDTRASHALQAARL
jgi:hypothetical protein